MRRPPTTRAQVPPTPQQARAAPPPAPNSPSPTPRTPCPGCCGGAGACACVTRGCWHTGTQPSPPAPPAQRLPRALPFTRDSPTDRRRHAPCRPTLPSVGQTPHPTFTAQIPAESLAALPPRQAVAGRPRSRRPRAGRGRRHGRTAGAAVAPPPDPRGGCLRPPPSPSVHVPPASVYGPPKKTAHALPAAPSTLGPHVQPLTAIASRTCPHAHHTPALPPRRVPFLCSRSAACHAAAPPSLRRRGAPDRQALSSWRPRGPGHAPLACAPQR